jgi:hypothetical protein
VTCMGIVESIIETKHCTTCGYDLTALNFTGQCIWEIDSDKNNFSYTHCANRAKARDHLKALESRLAVLEAKEKKK